MSDKKSENNSVDEITNKLAKLGSTSTSEKDEVKTKDAAEQKAPAELKPSEKLKPSEDPKPLEELKPSEDPKPAEGRKPPKTREQIANEYLQIESELCEKLNEINFGDEVDVFKPLDYAKVPHEKYVKTYVGEKAVIFVGECPGLSGTVETGVPFGDRDIVQNWLKIDIRDVQRPDNLPNPRNEECAKRFWSFMKKYCGTSKCFFRYCFVFNYCPYLFLDKKKIPNYIPLDKVTKWIKKACDEALVARINLIRPTLVIAVGNYVHDRVIEIKKRIDFEFKLQTITHPSPANPKANAGWEKAVLPDLQKCGAMAYLKKQETPTSTESEQNLGS